jgi:hypothetical protein
MNIREAEGKESKSKLALFVMYDMSHIYELR